MTLSTISVWKIRPVHLRVHVCSGVAMVFGVRPRMPSAGELFRVLNQIKVKFLPCGVGHLFMGRIVGSHEPPQGEDMIRWFADQSDRNPSFIIAFFRTPNRSSMCSPSTST